MRIFEFVVKETSNGSTSLTGLDRCDVRSEAEASGPQEVSAGPDAGAAVSLQPGVRRLRQDPVPRAHSEAELSPEECFKAVEECGTPMVAIPGGEPLLHPQMPEIVAGLVARKKYVYMCTNALLLKEKLHLFKPSKYLSFSVHVDGQREHHDFSVCREGGYDIAMGGVKAAVDAGFRVTTNTTLFDGADPNSVRAHFDELMTAGVESMMVSPGYTYDKAPDQKHFLGRARSKKMFRAILSNRKSSWRFNASPMFMEFLMGKKNLTCTPWGMPTFSIFGWQKPCYLLQDGYADIIQRADGDGRVAELRHGDRQSAMRELHGALRLRSQRCELHFWLDQGPLADGEGDLLQQVRR